MAAKYLILENFFIKYEEIQKFYYIESKYDFHLYFSTKEGKEFPFCVLTKALNTKLDLESTIRAFLMSIIKKIENCEKIYYMLDGTKKEYIDEYLKKNP